MKIHHIGDVLIAIQLEEEFNWYLANQDELVKSYDGKFIVIREQQVIGEYPNLGSAIDGTVAKGNEMGTFIV